MTLSEHKVDSLLATDPDEKFTAFQSSALHAEFESCVIVEWSDIVLANILRSRFMQERLDPWAMQMVRDEILCRILLKP